MITLKRATIAFAAALALVASLGLAACSGAAASPEEVIKADIAKQLDPVKNMDGELISQIVTQVESTGMASYGIDPEEFVKTLLEGFDYKVDSVVVSPDGNEAKANMTITARDFAAAMENAQADSTEFALGEAMSSLSEDEAMQKIGGIVIQAVKDAPLRDNPLTISYSKTAGNWSADASAETEIMQIFM